MCSNPPLNCFKVIFSNNFKFGTAASNMNVKEENICRLCLNKVPKNDFQIIDDITRNIFEVLLLRVNLDISKDPIICKECAELMMKCFNFKSACIDTEEILFCFVVDKNRSRSTFQLKDVYKETKYMVDDDFICRFCFNHSIENNFVLLDTLMKEVMFAKMVHMLMPEMDFNIVKNPLICTSCKQDLECYIKFVENCNDVEEKITKYMQNKGIPSSAQVTLGEVLQFLFKNILEIDYTQMHTIKQEDIILEDIDEAHSEVYDADLIKTEDLDIKDEEDNFCFEAACETSSDTSVPCESKSQFGDTQKTTTQISSFALATSNKMYLCDTKDYCCIKKYKSGSCVTVSETEMGKPCLTTYKNNKNKMNQVLTNKNTSEAQIFICAVCTYETRHKCILKQHMLIHKDRTEVETYKCAMCTFETKYKGCLKRHMLIHKDITEVEMYKCSMCTYETRHKCILKQHMLNHKNITEVKKYKCAMCTYETIHEIYLKRHMLIHKVITEVKIYKCSMCTYETRHKRSLIQHILIHKEISEVEMYKCSMCTYETRHKRVLKRHMLIHKDITEVEMYKCSMCTYEARHKCSLKQHMLIHKDISEVEMYKCAMCTYETKHKSGVKKHMLNHKHITEVKNYKCAMCTYETKHKSNLKKHMLIHKDITDVEIYKCSKCTFESKHKGYLKKHMLIHKDIRDVEMYKCSKCTFETKHNVSLKRHMLTHKDITDVEMYKCLVCTYGTKQKGNLKRHILVHNKGIRGESV